MKIRSVLLGLVLAGVVSVAGITMAGEPAGMSQEVAVTTLGKLSGKRAAELAVERKAEMEKEDPGGYVHMSHIYEGLGHWMNRKDAGALPWMAKFTRNPWPKKIVWLQDDVTHDRYDWLKIPDKKAAKANDRIVATVEGQAIRLDGDVPAKTELRLSDALLDLDREVAVLVNGKQVSVGKVPRTSAAIRQSLRERLDPPSAATAILVLP